MEDLGRVERKTMIKTILHEKISCLKRKLAKHVSESKPGKALPHGLDFKVLLEFLPWLSQ